MSFPRYPKYKESGVEWLGDVPEHWGVVPLMRLTPDDRQIMYGIVLPGPHVEGGVPIVKGGDVSPGRLNPDTLNRTTQEIESGYVRSRLRGGDIVYAIRGSIGEAAIVPNSLTDANLTQDAARISPRSEIDVRWLLFAMQSQGVFAQLDQTVNGATIRGINIYQLKRARIPVPPRNEQRILASFLIRETAKIDELIAEQRRLMELLKEKRQVVISHAVTKGLNPHAPMKPSGIEWLGDVPEHWKVGKCGFYLTILSGFAFPSPGFSDDATDARLLRGINVGVQRIKWDETVYWRRVPDDGLDEYEMRSGDLVIGMDRPVISEGVRVAKVQERDLPSLLLQRVASLKTGASLNADYFLRLLSSEMFEAHFSPETTGVSVPHISPEQIYNFFIPIPPIGEQENIAGYIDAMNAKADSLTTEAAQAIDLLQERRTALISAAVTGKIDVRALADSEAA